MSSALPFTFFATASVETPRKPVLSVAPSITAIEPLPSRWSEDLFEEWVRRRPSELLRLLDTRHLDGPDTALALEVASRALPTNIVVSVLLDALTDESALVREAAVYALVKHKSDPRARAGIERLTAIQSEPSAAVREAAQDALLFIDQR